MTGLELAIEAIEKTGWSAFPVQPSKAPWAGTHGHLDATDDVEALRAMWRDGSLPALAVPEGRVVVDEDAPGALVAAELAMPTTPIQKTPRGVHYFLSGDARPAVAVAKGVDVRGHGSYVVLYSDWWVDPQPLADAPAWVTERPRGRQVELGSEEAESFGEGERDAALTSAAGQMRNIGMTANEILAALKVMNRDRCIPPLPDSQVVKIARSALSWERGRMPVIRTVRSQPVPVL